MRGSHPAPWLGENRSGHTFIPNTDILVHNDFLYDIFRNMICSCSEDMQDRDPSRLNRGTAPLALRDG